MRWWGPITHVVHGNWGRMGLNLLTRAALPMAGLLLGASGCDGGGDGCVESVLAGGALGMVASSLDLGLIAREPKARSRAQAWLAPALELGPDHAVFGALGAF
jgi:hypothetical protein